MNRAFYLKEIQMLKEIVEKQSHAIDKAISDSKILRKYLEFPQSVAECAVNGRRYFDSIDSAYQGGYEKALIDIKESLGIKEYATKEEVEKMLNDLGL